MVEHIDGQGMHYRDVLQTLGKAGPNIGIRTFRITDEELHAQVVAEITVIPRLNTESVSLVNVVDSRGREARVIAGPKRLFEPYMGYSIIDRLPQQGETFFTLISSGNYNETDLVIADTRERAERISVRRMREKGLFRRDFQVAAVLVSPQDFIEIARTKIEAGEGDGLHPSVTRFAGLRDYRNQFDLRVKEKVKDKDSGNLKL